MSSVATKFEPGTLVRYRKREWVVLSISEENRLHLRPLGSPAESGLVVDLALSEALAQTLPYEAVEPARFAAPTTEEIGDETAVQLLFQSARMLIRDGTAPFQSFARISIRPRQYQLVPLLMSLQMDTVRLLIGDDVGVGKTIEAGLIARELLERGDAERLCVICPPYLCDQWHKELLRKFQIATHVVRSGTLSRLERSVPHPDISVFEHYKHLVVSVDLVKSDRYKNLFVRHCPDLVLVDEVHGMASPPASGGRRGVQQRYELISAVAGGLVAAPNSRSQKPRHMVLLSATPHAGVEESFLSVLGLLDRSFESLDLNKKEDRDRLSPHFVQRRRGDLVHWLGEDTPFPERDESNLEQGYAFSSEYKKFFNDVHAFARGIVQSAETMSGNRRRMRFYSALALLRSISSSPAAAFASLSARMKRLMADPDADDEILVEELRPQVFDPEDGGTDSVPASIVDGTEWDEAEYRKLGDFARRAEKLQGDQDAKAAHLKKLVKDQLEGGRSVIVWCRYIATAHYVGDFLKSIRGTTVSVVTGEIPEDERRLRIDEMGKSEKRVLVATDCLSEGINLQEHFNTVVHYDLPWNPNRMEQREGRVDRYGQNASKIGVFMMYGRDNPVDGIVLDVLIRRARAIRRSLGIQVSVPLDSESIMETVIHSTLLRQTVANRAGAEQYLLDLPTEDPARKALKTLEQYVDMAEQRDRETRTIFSQRTLRVGAELLEDELKRQLAETDRVLGSPADVQNFFLDAANRLAVTFKKRGRREPQAFEVRPHTLPRPVHERLGELPDRWHVCFHSPEPEESQYVGRNDPLIESLAEYLFSSAFEHAEEPGARRLGVVRTDAVQRVTTLLLYRARYSAGGAATRIAEEVVVAGFRGTAEKAELLAGPEAAGLLAARAAGNLSEQEKRTFAERALKTIPQLRQQLDTFFEQQTNELNERNRSGQKALKQGRLRWRLADAPDLLGALILTPAVAR